MSALQWQRDVDDRRVEDDLADPSRAKILLALGDGRALPASVLAAEAGVAMSTASSHLGKLLDGGLLTVEQHGRHRYFRMAGPEVGALIEAIARVAPMEPVRSLRAGNTSQAVRYARTCYDHLAGMLGTELFAALLARGDLAGGDGTFTTGDHLSSPGSAVDYRLTSDGLERLGAFGIDFDALPSRRPWIRYCVDWSEQRHHLDGSVGAALATRMIELGWVRRAAKSRAVFVTDDGRAGLREAFAVQLHAR